MPEFSSILEEAARHEEDLNGERRPEIARIPLDLDATVIVRPKPIDPRQKRQKEKAKKTIGEKNPRLLATKKPKTPEKKPIQLGTKFSSFAEFEISFNEWKAKNFHPFRTASSETLREPDGSINGKYKYRYIVYHCSHYGTPRVRSNTSRKPRSKYLPCGCKAMLRLNFSFNEKKLVIVVLNEEHTGHKVSEEIYEKLNRRNRAKLVQSDAEDDEEKLEGNKNNNEPCFEPTLNFARVMAPRNFMEVLEQHKKLIGLPVVDSNQCLHDMYSPQIDFHHQSTNSTATQSFASEQLTMTVSSQNETAETIVPALAENPHVQATIRKLLTHLSNVDEETMMERLNAIDHFILKA